MKREDVEDHRLGSFLFESFPEDVIGLPHRLLRRSADVGGDSVFLEKRCGNESLVDLAVADENDVVRVGRVIVTAKQMTLAVVVACILKNGTEIQNRSEDYKERANKRYNSYILLHSAPP